MRIVSLFVAIGVMASLSILEASSENYNIPAWIKNNAKWWSEDQIGDSDFVKGIEYLIGQGIMKIPASTVHVAKSNVIPAWIKNNAGWWSNGTITDNEFVQGIQYLINEGIINVSSTSMCNQSLWDHVYHPDRLQVVEECKTVSGIIDNIRVEKDGDYHIRLNLDPEYADLINDVNVSDQHGDLVVEPICENPVEQEDAIDACSDFNYTVNVPPVGTHVKVTGSYVLDTQHGWMEIHPVTRIVID